MADPVTRPVRLYVRDHPDEPAGPDDLRGVHPADPSEVLAHPAVRERIAALEAERDRYRELLVDVAREMGALGCDLVDLPPKVAALEADLTRARDVLAAERGERGPEGWRFQGGAWFRAWETDSGFGVARGGVGEWYLSRSSDASFIGIYPTALDAMEAADRAAGKE